jgi:hypothetical protein
MACTYCGANLTIPERLRIKIIPKAEKTSAPPQKIDVIEVDASQVLRKAQPILTGAWNVYAYGTLARWVLPACLTLVVVILLICAALGLFPILWISNWISNR